MNTPESAEFAAELVSLTEQLQDIESRLLALTGGEIDVVLSPAGRTHLLAQAQQRLLASEEEQRRAAAVQTAVLDALPAHVALLDAQGRIVSVNEAWKRFGAANGLPDGRFGVGTDYAAVCDVVEGPGAPKAPEAAQGLRAVLAGEAPSFALEYACHSADQQHWYRMMVTPLDPSRSAGAVVMHVDISQRVRAENALRDSEQRYRSIVDVLPDLVFTATSDRITFINRAGLRLLGATEASQVLGLRPSALFAADGPTARCQALPGQPTRPESAGFVEDRLLALDGSLVDVEVASSTYIEGGQQVVQVVCRDLSERRQSELRQQQLTDRLTSTLETLTDGFCTLDRDWRITYLNPLAQRMLARPREALLGHRVWSAFPGSENTRIGQALRRAMEERAAVQLVEHFMPADRWYDMRIYGSEHGLALYARDVTRERQLAAQLEEEHERLVQAQALAHMGSWETYLDSEDVVWSEEHHRIFETDPRTFRPTRSSVFALMDPEYRSAVEAAFMASFESREPQSIEHRLTMPDGRIKYIQERWRIVPAADGRRLRALGVCQDITERRVAEQELRRSQALVDLAGHMARLGAWSVEVPAMTVHWSDVVALIHEEPEGTSPSVDTGIAYYAPAHRDTVRTHFLRCVEDGTPFDLELQIVTARGRHRWVRLIGQAERDEAGRIVRVHGAFQEISDRKAAEQATRELAERLQTTLESITDGFITMDPQWRFTYVNRQAEQLLGRDRASLLGRDMWVEFPESLGTSAQEAYERAVRDRVATAFEYDYAPLNRWFEVNVYPSTQGLAVYFRDVTGRKRDQDALRELNAELEARVLARTAELSRAREQAEQASQAKSAFLAAMSHEIRTPMNGVIGMIDVLHQTSLQGYQVEMVDLIRDSANSLLGIIEDILDFSKIEAGRMDIDHAPLRLADVVEAVCSMLDHMASRLDVGIAVFVDPAIPPVMGDQARLRQVLVNLVGNAVKFSGSGSGRPRGQVSVRARLLAADAQGVSLELSVADNGIGMDEATMERLFRPFSQADVSTTRRFGGTGLGLAISGSLVQLMGGTISVRSALGQGATFTTRLTLPRAEGEPAVDAATLRAAEAVAGLRCCIIEGDEAPLAEDLATYLAWAGVDVERVARPAETLAAPLWLVLPGPAAAGPERLRALAPAGGQTRFVLLGSGSRRRPRVEAADLVRLDVCGLTRRSLYQVLALAGGRLADDAAADGDRGEGAAPVAAKAVRPGLRLERGQILVAEDNDTNRKVIQQQLNLIGLDAEFADDGAHAFDLWRSGDFGLVFTDLHMPRMDGYALTAAIRAEEQARGLPRTAILALTANALRDEEQRCLAAGMDAYLSKPVRLTRLKAAVQQWLPLVATAAATAAPAPAPGPEQEAPPLVDLSVLKALIGDDEAVVAEVLRAFRESAGESGAALASALAAGNLRGVAEAAHKLKSGARSIGARPLGQRCEEMEAAAESGRHEAIAALAGLFEADLQAVFRFLEAR